VAEVRKRGEDFWAEFEFYLSDLLVGIALDVVLVSLMAPKAVLGGGAVAAAGGSGEGTCRGGGRGGGKGGLWYVQACHKATTCRWRQRRGTPAAVLCCAVLCCAVLCCAVLCCAVLCCAVLCCGCAQQQPNPLACCDHNLHAHPS
jgi:hypothetical protein